MSVWSAQIKMELGLKRGGIREEKVSPVRKKGVISRRHRGITARKNSRNQLEGRKEPSMIPGVFNGKA